MTTHLRRLIPAVIASVLVLGTQACVPSTTGEIPGAIRGIWAILIIGLLALGGIAVAALRKATAAERELRALQVEVEELVRRSSRRSG